MKRTVAVVLILTILISIFAAVPTAFAKKKKQKLAKHYYAYTESGKALNLREKPDIKSKSLLKIPFGDELGRRVRLCAESQPEDQEAFRARQAHQEAEDHPEAHEEAFPG